jgi:diadenosine tetraphosphate (Ap4A) HIT family hydrolase
MTDACPICERGVPLDVIAELSATWVTAAADGPLPGYACIVSKRHVHEPFELSAVEEAAFWRETMLVARVLQELYEPAKLNYEIHGNTIPHLHMHLYPRYPGDPYEGRPLDGSASFKRCGEDLEQLAHAIATAIDEMPR